MQDKIKMDKKELKSKATLLQPVLRLGKNGLTDNTMDEAKKLLKKRKLIKIKILNNCPTEDKNGLIEEIIKKTGSELISKTGNVFVLWKK
ncbi:YhbY family RNA-binding protein [Candidatus Woesearchaeota archaeon]|nr:YhbY family RNA-binding protein [Candidatus Woesearchaeota archaeon]